MLVTYLIMFFTSAISLVYMNNQEFKNRFMFNAYAIKHRGEWWRFFTGGILHADGMHLLFNMITLYFFGEVVETWFNQEGLFGHGLGTVMFFLMYVLALPLSSFYSYLKHRDNMYYNALGASGAVSAVVYAFILLAPTAELRIFFSIPITGWIYGIIYLAISYALARRNVGNIGHDAHFYGAVFGFIFPICFFPFLAERFIAEIIGSVAG